MDILILENIKESRKNIGVITHVVRNIDILHVKDEDGDIYCLLFNPSINKWIELYDSNIKLIEKELKLIYDMVKKDENTSS